MVFDQSRSPYLIDYYPSILYFSVICLNIILILKFSSLKFRQQLKLETNFRTDCERFLCETLIDI